MDEKFAKATGGRLLVWQPATGRCERQEVLESYFWTVMLIVVAEPFDRAMQVVAELQRQLVRARLELHVDLGVAGAEVHPVRCPLHDLGAGRQAILFDADMVMAHARPNLRRRDRILRDRRELVAFEAKAELHRALHRRAVGGLDEKHAARRRRRCGRRRRSGGRRFGRRLGGRLRSAACACGHHEHRQWH